MKIANYFFGRNHSFAFTLLGILLTGALLREQYWIAAALFLLGIPCIGIAEVIYQRRTKAQESAQLDRILVDTRALSDTLRAINQRAKESKRGAL